MKTNKYLQFISLCMVMSLCCAGCAIQYPFSSSNHNEDSLSLSSLRQPERKSCASTCLYAVARYWGIQTTVKQIEKELGKMPEDGYALSQLHDWAIQHDLLAYVISGTIEDIEYHTKKRRPIIVIIKKGKQKHSIVIKTITTTGDILAMDPRKGKTIKISKNDFLEHWQSVGNPMLIIAPALDNEK